MSINNIENIMNEIENEIETMSSDSIREELLKGGYDLCTNDNLHLYGIPLGYTLEEKMDEIQHETLCLDDVFVKNELSKAGITPCTTENLDMYGISMESEKTSFREKCKRLFSTSLGRNERAQGFSLAAIPALAIAVFSWGTHSSLILAQSTIESNETELASALSEIDTNSAVIASKDSEIKNLKTEISTLKSKSTQFHDSVLSIISKSNEFDTPELSAIPFNIKEKKKEFDKILRLDEILIADTAEVLESITNVHAIASIDFSAASKDEDINLLNKEIESLMEHISKLDNKISGLLEVEADQARLLEKKENMYEIFISEIDNKHKDYIGKLKYERLQDEKLFEELESILGDFDIQ